MIIYILCLLVISYLTWYFYKNIYIFQKNANIPGPNFFKSLQIFRPANIGLLFNYVNEHKIFKDFFAIWTGPYYLVLAVDPEAAKFVLKDPRFPKAEPVVASQKQREYFGENLLSLEGDDWRRVRNIIHCGFTEESLSSYYPIFMDLTEKAIHILPLDSDFEISDFFSRFTIDILGKTIFNYDFRRLDGGNDKYYKAYRGFFEIFARPWGMLMLLFPWVSKLPVKPSREYDQCIEVLVELFKGMIKEHKDKRNDNSILSNLLNAVENQDLLTEKELIANMFLFFVAGHETTATALIWALNCLLFHPDIQEKLYEEIRDNIGEGVPTEKELEKLEYLDAFINEILRLHSPVSFSGSRRASEDVKYKDMIIPKGSTVGVYFNILQTNPEYWDEPLNFNPERFLAEKKKGRNHFSHIPFSAGLRQCIGNNFSLIEQRLFLTRLLQKYRVVKPKQNKPLMEDQFLAFGLANSVYVRFEKRNQ